MEKLAAIISLKIMRYTKKNQAVLISSIYLVSPILSSPEDQLHLYKSESPHPMDHPCHA